MENNYTNTRAFIGQKLVHFPQRIHKSKSTVGAELPVCLSAPTGHIVLKDMDDFVDISL